MNTDEWGQTPTSGHTGESAIRESVSPLVGRGRGFMVNGGAADFRTVTRYRQALSTNAITVTSGRARTLSGEPNAAGTDIGLLLIHSPSETMPLEDSIAALNRLQDEGIVDHISVSNFSVSQMRAAMAASETPILTDQVEYHPFEDRTELHELCVEHDRALTAYSPLADGPVLRNQPLRRIGDRYEKTAAQVALRWLIQQENMAAIPKAASKRHQRENIDVFDFELADDEMAQIAELVNQ